LRRITTILTVVLAGSVGSIAVSTLVSGNARRTTGSLSVIHAAETPFVAELAGRSDLPGPIDFVGTGAASISFGALDELTTEVCWDMWYTGLVEPITAEVHIQSGTLDLGQGGANLFSGCTEVSGDVWRQVITDTPSYPIGYVLVKGLPGWGTVQGSLFQGPSSTGAMHLLHTPLRAYDSRVAPATKINPGETRIVSLAFGADIASLKSVAVPPGAAGAIITVTAAEPAGPGFVKVYSAASAEPAASNLNFTTAGAVVAVGTQVAVDANSQIKVTAGPAATHVIIDVVGYMY
jgi:hypothetical protein